MEVKSLKFQSMGRRALNIHSNDSLIQTIHDSISEILENQD